MQFVWNESINEVFDQSTLQELTKEKTQEKRGKGSY